MQLLKVAENLQDGGQPESDYDSRGSDSEHSDREEESQVHIYVKNTNNGRQLS